jgi:DNA polymerase-4
MTLSAAEHTGRPTPTVLHLDIDAFFASVEQLLFPMLRGRPVAVGNGVIASCSYEAREFGLSAGMPLHRARARCRELVVLNGSYPVYRCFAEHVWAICRRYVTALETFLDEACGNATGIARRYGGPRELGLRIQREVREEVGLPVSVGLASNRMMAKIGSGLEKPYGVVAIPPGQEPRFLAPLPIDKLPGVGPKTRRILRDMNVSTIGQLAQLPRELLRSMLGYRGELLHDRAQGRDGRAIRPDALPKSISRETTFHEPLRDDGPIRGMIFYLLQRAARAARDDALVAGRVELSIRYDDWKETHTAHTLPDATDSEETFFRVACELLDRLYTRRVALRHVRVILSKLSPAAAHAPLLEHETRRQERRLHAAVDAVRDRWGHSSLVSGKSIELLGELEQNDHGFVLRTPSLTK